MLEALSKNRWIGVMQSDVDSGEDDDVWATIGRSHAAYQILNNWTDSVHPPIPQHNEMVVVPKATAISEPGDFIEQSFDVAQRLIALQQMFVMKLIETGNGQTSRSFFC
jgi:hypothetical protein